MKSDEHTQAFGRQIGGSHYTELVIQPMVYSMFNGLDALQHTVVKYVSRFRQKGGIGDLEKARHCIDMLIEYEADRLKGKDIVIKAPATGKI